MRRPATCRRSIPAWRRPPAPPVPLPALANPERRSVYLCGAALRISAPHPGRHGSQQEGTHIVSDMTPLAPGRGPSFGIATAPAQVAYDDLARVWREADAIPQVEHAWLYDHLMPIFGDPDGPAFEGWTLLAALAAQTERLRLGLLVTSNRFRPPAMLAKIAAGVDVISGGRLEFGIGAGSNVAVPIARR